MPITYTPLRFPGGKSKIYPLVESLVKENDLIGGTYAEAFCGGAGLAMKLLLKGCVSRVVLNDIDPAVYSIWNAIIHYPDELCKFIANVPTTVEKWKEEREIYQHGKVASLELGEAAFYLNRTNRSGILDGGLIGGLEQAGAYKMNARFNRANLIDKVRAISSRATAIELHCLDVHEFMTSIAACLPKKSLLYLDPPYVEKGPGLYHSSFNESKHCQLASDVKDYKGNWMVTYDDDELVHRLYSPEINWCVDVEKISVGYSAATKRRSNEMLILSPSMVSSQFQK